MITTLILISASLIFTILELNILAISCLCVSIVFVLFHKKKNGKTAIAEQTINKYVLTSNVLRMHRISDIIDCGLLDGHFLISKVFINKLLETDSKDILNNDYSMENIEYSKRNDLIMEIPIEDNITSYFKYAFENSCTIVITKEKAANNLFKIFKVKSINLEYLSSENNRFKQGKNIHYVITKKNKNKYEGYHTSNVKIFLNSNKNISYGIKYGKINNVLKIKNDTSLIMEDDNDD